MTHPLVVNLPHKLGREEAKRRIAANTGKLTEHLPGGADVKSSWDGDRLNLDVAAMGQRVTSQIDVQDNVVRVEVVLPGILAMFGNTIAGFLSRKGGELLEDKSKS